MRVYHKLQKCLWQNANQETLLTKTCSAWAGKASTRIYRISVLKQFTHCPLSGNCCAYFQPPVAVVQVEFPQLTNHKSQFKKQYQSDVWRQTESQSNESKKLKATIFQTIFRPRNFRPRKTLSVNRATVRSTSDWILWKYYLKSRWHKTGKLGFGANVNFS